MPPPEPAGQTPLPQPPPIGPWTDSGRGRTPAGSPGWEPAGWAPPAYPPSPGGAPPQAPFTYPQPRPRRAATRILLRLAGPMLGVAVAAALLGWHLVPSRSRTIPGAPGYTTYGGPHGYLLAEGRPWGGRCQPLRFSVASPIPAGDYEQIASVVRAARAVGVDVTIESPSFMWIPSDVYPPGQNNATVRRIGIFPTWATAPKLSNGRPERINFGWNAAVSPDGHHERLTDLQATLYMGEVGGHPDRLRIAIRQLIAFSQGVGGSSAAGSGIARGTTADSFSSGDLHAMELMSGCDFQSAPPVPAGG